jgi:peptidyl-prolyl cis-trans isomerase D
MDAFNSNTGIIGKKNNTFAKIDGTDISPAQFDAKYGEVLTQYLTQSQQLINYQQGSYTIDNQTEFQLREQAWNELVQEFLMGKQLTAAGLHVTEAEKTDLIYGPDPHPYIKNYYAGLSGNGVYDPGAFNQYITFIKNPENQQNNAQVVQAYFDFLMRENLAIKDYTNSKYISMFTKADYVPEWMVKRDYNIKNRRVNFDFVDVAYTTIVDSTIQVTDAELKAYYNEHKNKFKQKDASRTVEYIMFPFFATPQDSADILVKLQEDMVNLRTAKNDSAFIAVRSEDPNRITRAYNNRQYYYQSGLDSSTVDSLFSVPEGSLFGPYLNDLYYTATLVKSRKMLPDSVDARHILISTQVRDSIEARNLADSLLTALQAGSDFATLAQQFSDDAGSGAQGGELGWSTPQTDFVKPFKDFVFETGSVAQPAIVESPFGFHIIDIKEVKGRGEYMLAYNLSRFIDASSATADSVDRIANEFFNTYKTPEAFEEGAAEKGFSYRLSPPFAKTQYEIPGIPDSRGIITWAYNAKVGEFNYFNTYSDRIVVAYVASAREAGIGSFEAVEDQLRVEVIRQKKGEQLKAKMETAVNGKDLAAAASSLNSAVKTSTNATYGTPYAPGIGLEQEVVGKVMATQKDGVTPVIAGNRGVYVAKVTSITEPPADGDLTLNRNQMTYGFRNKISQQNVLRSLTDNADVEDNRFNFGY